MTTLVELYAGTAALSLHLFGRKPPVSRIGSKQGYAAAIEKELGIRVGWAAEAAGWKRTERVLLVDTDPWICATLRALCSGHGPWVANALGDWPATKKSWAQARAATRELAPISCGPEDDAILAARWLYVTAASRGGVGGFKGGHIRRPSVKGWIPSLPSLCRRLQAFDKDLPVKVRCARAQDIAPFGDSVVYLDPPYPGRAKYPWSSARVVLGADRHAAAEPLPIRAWLEKGAIVAISSPNRSPQLHCGACPDCGHAAEYHLGPELGFRCALCGSELNKGCARTRDDVEQNAIKCHYRRVELTQRRKGQKRRSLTRSSEEWLHIFEPG